MLLQFELDVALAEAPVTAREITIVPWRIDEMVVIAAPTHPLASRRGIEPSDLSKELFVLREPESGTRGIVLRALPDAGVEVSRTMSVDGTEVIRQVVAEGLGIAVVSRIAVAISWRGTTGDPRREGAGDRTPFQSARVGAPASEYRRTSVLGASAAASAELAR